MNPERLLAHYEKVIETPDAIDRLRRLILDLAVRGKLVPEDPKDEPASELLKRITKVKERKINAGKIKRETLLGGISSTERSYEIRKSWEWVRLNTLTELVYGKLLPTSELLEKGYDVFGANGIIGKFSSYLYKDPMLLISCRGAYSGSPNISPPQCFVTNNSIVCEFFDSSCINIYYLHFVLSVASRKSIVTGTAQPQVTIAKAITLPIPLPPLAEQHRIVAKVDELMALCDQLEAAQAEREATRDRLTVSSLARLNTPDPDSFKSDVKFALDALPALTTRADQIKQLRQTILNLAVRGKLVAQDPKDEPASELLKRIAKQQTLDSKRKSVEAEINNEEELGELPPAWCAVPLVALGNWAIGSGFPKNEQGLESGPYLFLKVSDMNLPENKKYITTSNNFIDEEAAQRIRAKIHSPGTIIFPKIGGAIATNKRRILTRAAAIDNNCLGITFASELDIEWAFLLLTTLDFTRYQAGTAVPALQQGVLERIPIPLPPLAEQHRIVAKVNEVMAVCDQLEFNLTTATNIRSDLLDALLAEAIAPKEALGAS